jgi:hypothetical protein
VFPEPFAVTTHSSSQAQLGTAQLSVQAGAQTRMVVVSNPDACVALGARCSGGGLQAGSSPQAHVCVCASCGRPL